MSALSVIALIAGIIWLVLGVAMTTVALVFKDGIYMGGGSGWGGVIFYATLTLPAVGLIVWAVT